MPTWPESLEQKPLRDGFSIAYEPNLVESSTETGPGKTRPRQTHAPILIPPSVVVSKAQKKILQSFYVETLAFGSIPFSWPDLDSVIDDDTTHSYRMTAPPTFTPSGVDWIAKMQLKVW